jgi:hypothetical protein
MMARIFMLFQLFNHGSMQSTRKSLFYYVFIIFLFYFPITETRAQSSALSHTRKKLAVSDYKGVPDENSNFLARTNPVLSYQYSTPVSCGEKGKIRFTFNTTVSLGSKSWMKVSMIRKPEVLNELLSHEQGHFDISQIFSIDLEKKLSSLCFDKTRFKTEIDSVFRLMNTYYDSLQKKYDADTGYMMNRESQTKWKQRISAMYRKVKEVDYEAK